MGEVHQLSPGITQSLYILQKLRALQKQLYRIVAPRLIDHADPQCDQPRGAFLGDRILRAQVFPIIDLRHQAQQIADLVGADLVPLIIQRADDPLRLVHIICRQRLGSDLAGRARCIAVWLPALAVSVIEAHPSTPSFCFDTHRCRWP